MQKTTLINDASHDLKPIGDLLADSGFEQEQPDPEYLGDPEDEEAIEE